MSAVSSWRSPRSESDSTSVADVGYRYENGERLPIEVLVFEMDPDHVAAFCALDHEVWTLGEAYHGTSVGDPDHHIPFLSKEVWLDDAHPGRVTLVFVWESIEAWMHMGDSTTQAELQARFDAAFEYEVRLVSAPHEDSSFGIHRWSRFERL